MKLLHTADWHLGRYLKGYSLLKDQKHLLDQLTELIREEKPAVHLVGGDIFDRAVPAAEALEVFHHFLRQTVLELGCPTVIIAGNHDSGERIGLYHEFLRDKNLFLSGKLRLPLQPVVLQDATGEVHIYPVPYFEPEDLNFALHQHGKSVHTQSHHEAWEQLLKELPLSQHPSTRNVLVGHLFAQGGKTSESDEEEFSRYVGTAGQVNARLFQGFDYVALGHLHAAHFVPGTAKTVRYASSLMPYSVSEAHQTKSVSLVELEVDGNVRVSERQLTPRRTIRKVSGKIEDGVLQTDAPAAYQYDFVEVALQNTSPVPNAMALIKAQFPNALPPRWPRRQLAEGSLTHSIEDLSKANNELEIFTSFFSFCHKGELPDEQRNILREVIATLKNE